MTESAPPVMTDRKPYLLRALHEWITDNDMTPHVVVQANLPNVAVPNSFVQNNQITLSIAPRSVQGLSIDHFGIRFAATFGGELFQVQAPSESILAIFARESGQGMVFSEPKPEPDPDSSEEAQKSSGRPSLRVVK